MSQNREIAKAAGTVGGLTLLSRVAGLARDVVIGYFFGAGAAAEAFFVAFRFPNLFRRLAAEGAMAVAFVPVFSRYVSTRSRDDAAAALRAVLGAFLPLLLAMAAAGAWLAPRWVAWFAPGFATDPELMALAVPLARVLIPYVVLIGAVAVCAGFLNANRHFVAPALSPALLNFCVIGAAALLATRLTVPVFALAIGVLLGGCAQLIAQMVALRRLGFAAMPRLDLRHEAVRLVAQRMGPVFASQAVFQVNVMVATILASFLPLGSVSYLWYAERVYEFPLGLFASALGTAVLPTLTRQAARRQHRELRESLAFALSLNSFLAVPAAIGLIALAEPIVALLFERGAFSAADTRHAAAALRCFAVGLWAAAINRVLTPALFAVGDTRTPIIGAAVSMVLNVFAALVLMGPVPARASGMAARCVRALQEHIGWLDLDHMGLALATSITATLSVGFLAIALRWRLGGEIDVRRVALATLRSALASLPMLLAVLGAQGLGETLAIGGTVVRALVLLGVIATGVAVFSACALAIGGPEVARAREIARSWLRSSDPHRRRTG